MKTLALPNGRISLPAFLPDGTQGVVRAIDGQDLLASGIQAVQMNVYHLMQRPGSSTIQALGGLHKMAGWPHPIFTDSGGFQVYSLIRQNAKLGSISDKGAQFRIEGKKFQLTPEKSVQLQMSYGSDIIICLDDCTHVDSDMAVQKTAVRRTVAWAKRCKTEFTHLLEQKQLPPEKQPKLVAVVQGGGSVDLRRQCADQLLDIGFDGYGYGGWPLDSNNKLLTEMVATVRESIPRQFTVHALGIGHPDNIRACVEMGYELFDSTMPTRDARHGRLYIKKEDGTFGYLYIKDKKHIKANRPLMAGCDCHVCTTYSAGYLHHLFKVNDHLYHRFATIHNLRFMTLLMQELRDGIAERERAGGRLKQLSLHHRSADGMKVALRLKKSKKVVRREQLAVERLLEDERLTADLDDAAATLLLNWGMRETKRIAGDTAVLPDEEAEAAMYPRLRALRTVMRYASNWFGKRGTTDERANRKLIKKIVTKTAVIHPDTFTPADKAAQLKLAQETCQQSDQTKLVNILCAWLDVQLS